MLYPLAVLARETGEVRHVTAAIRAGDWLVRIQQPGGAWGEESPHHDGWTGTTADQLLALAGAYPLLGDWLSREQRKRWRRAIRHAGDFLAYRMPGAHLNYAPTCAVALRLARSISRWPRPDWWRRERRFVERTLRAIRPDGLLDGEGGGVDPGYNLSQTIGYLALYGLLTRKPRLREQAAHLLRAHIAFIYPNGAVDNSWGTRAYKWTYDSGTKTAPGIHFTLAVLLDQDCAFASMLDRTLEYLKQRAVKSGWVIHGPHAHRHVSATPPCNYGTFARAQSLALALAYGRPAAAATANGDSEPPGLSFIPDLRVAVVRTGRLVATVSAYAATSQYHRRVVSRGGSLTSLWVDGYSEDGFVQASSPVYDRAVEPMHLPSEEGIVPLTPRIELNRAHHTYSNLFETEGQMQARQTANGIEVSVTGELRDAEGASSGVRYVLTHLFVGEQVQKRIRLQGAVSGSVVVIEPLVKPTDDSWTVFSGGRAQILDSSGTARAELRVITASTHAVLTPGKEPRRYWAPFPGVECLPVEIELPLGSRNGVDVQYEIAVLTQREKSPDRSPICGRVRR